MFLPLRAGAKKLFSHKQILGTLIDDQQFWRQPLKRQPFLMGLWDDKDRFWKIYNAKLLF